MWFRGLVLGVSVVVFIASTAWGTTERVLFETRFESSEGYDPALTLAEQGWLKAGSGGNGLVTNFFAGEGQHAFIGFTAPTNGDAFLNVWRPVNYMPGPTNPPLVRFSVLMSIEDSSTSTNRDDFRWSVYNVRGDRLFTLDFDNNSLGINYLLDREGANDFVATGWSFTNFVTYELAVVMNFQSNLWSAQLGGVTVVTNQQVTTRGSPLSFGDVDAVWAIRQPGQPGDNYMVFDNYRIVVGSAPNPPPRLEVVSRDQFLVRCLGVPGVHYLVEGAADLAAWLPLATNVMPADGDFEYRDDRAGLRLQFYRLSEK